MPAATQLPDGTWDYGDRIYDPSTQKFTPKGGAGAKPSTDFTSTAADDPRQAEVYDLWKKRLSTDVTKRAIDRSNLATMDAAALGAADAKANLSSRGALGAGAGATFVNRNITQPAIRDAAGKAADISLGREGQLDALTLAGGPLASNMASNNLAQRQFGLEQWNAQQADAARRAAMEQEQRNTELAQMMAITQMMGNFGSTFPGGINAAPAGGAPSIGNIFGTQSSGRFGRA